MGQFLDRDGLDVRTSIHGYTLRLVDASGTVGPRDRVVRLETTQAGAHTLTLGPGRDGQGVDVVMASAAGGGTFTTSGLGGGEVVFAAAGDAAQLVYDASAGWGSRLPPGAGGPINASGVTYTPSTPDDWNPLPSNAAAALDTLGARGQIFLWRNDNVASSTTVRYLKFGGDSGQAPTSEATTQVAIARLGVIRTFSVTQGSGAGNGNDIDYVLRVNGADSGFVVTKASTEQGTTNATGTVTVAPGDLLSVCVRKALAIGSSPTDITAFIEFN